MTGAWFDVYQKGFLIFYKGDNVEFVLFKEKRV
ncbi:hypothetical protein EUR_19390 [Agathobacter rectalis DSM 17629]|nr:hypothetical protein EUR_19390 [Agathobacter rectalis DSM 17629]